MPTLSLMVSLNCFFMHALHFVALPKVDSLRRVVYDHYNEKDPKKRADRFDTVVKVCMYYRVLDL